MIIYFTQFIIDKYEGAILRLDAPYEHKRSKNLLKYKKFDDEGNEIYFITYRTNKNPLVLDKTKRWLKEKGFKYHKLFMRSEDKGKVCKDNDVSVFIDNTYTHIEDANNYGIDTILFDTIYNRDIDYDKRMDNWEDIYKYIKEVYDGKNS